MTPLVTALHCYVWTLQRPKGGQCSGRNYSKSTVCFVKRLWTVKAVSRSCNQKTTIRSVWGDKKVLESLILQAVDKIICSLTERVIYFHHVIPSSATWCSRLRYRHPTTLTMSFIMSPSDCWISKFPKKKDCREGCVVAISCHQGEDIYWNL